MQELFPAYMCGAEKRGENTGREAWALGANRALPNSSYQLISLRGELKADLVECSTPEGQRSAVTRLGLLRTKLLKKLLLIWVCCCEGLRVSRTHGNSGCAVGRAGQALPGQAGLGLTGSGFAQGALDPGRSAQSPLRPLPWHSGGQRVGMGHVGSCHGSPGCRRERPGRLSEPWDGKQTVCIGLLRKAGLPRYSGRQNHRAWYCAHLSSPNTQRTSPYQEQFRDIRLSDKWLGFLRN